MAEMMENILVLGRLDAGKMDCRPTPLDLGMFCRRVVDEVQSATERRCPIEVSMAPGSLQCQADEGLLGHIFTNLLSNAVKYSEPGKTVRLTLKRDDLDAVAVVEDMGIGIPDADQTSIFIAFQRGGNVGERPGTGLGLMLVKRCVELHGGRVSIVSQLGKGTTVTVRLKSRRCYGL
jgi:signal transduction histidine kinase